MNDTHFARLLAIVLLCSMVSDGTSKALGQESREPGAVKVFLLAGQSNMEGHGVVDLDDERDYNGGRGNLANFLASEDGAPWRDLRRGDGSWAVRDDVFVSYRTGRGELKSGPLSVGYGVHPGAHHIGPELGFGWVLGAASDDPVLLVKTCWGGKSLAKDFRPPSAGGEVGPYYRQMLEEYREAIASMGDRFPALEGRTPKLEGVVWFQGWNDACDRAATAEYSANLKRLVDDLRSEFGDPALAIVVGETGNWDGEEFRGAQRAGCEGLARVVFVPTRAFLQPAAECPNQTHGHHWFGSGGSYLQAGDAMGKAMVPMLPAPTASVAPGP